MDRRRMRPTGGESSTAEAPEPSALLGSYISLVQSQLVPPGASSGQVQAKESAPESEDDRVGKSDNQDTDNEPPLLIGRRRAKHGSGKGYSRASFASVLPEYSLADQDTIKSAFLPTSFTRISQLPNKLKPDAVRHAKPQQIRRNLVQEPHFHTQARPMNQSGMFVDLIYKPSTYDFLENKKKTEKHEQTQKLQLLCRDRFQGPGVGVKLKYEDPCDPNYRYPRLDDPFGEEEAQRKREKLESLAKVVSGPFKPTGRKLAELDCYNAAALSRKSLLDIIRKLHSVLVEDWPDQDFTVAATMDDFIAMAFELPSLDSLRALLSYMDVLVLRNPVCQNFLLSKVRGVWGVEVQPGKVWFLLRPAWVKPNTVPQMLIKPLPADDEQVPEVSPVMEVPLRNYSRMDLGASSKNVIIIG